MKTGTRLLILCLLAPAALAENMSLRSGRVLKDAVVVSSGDDFVNIQYTDGVAKVSYKDLKDGGSGAQKEGGRSQEGGR